jgi:hypothetical protein
MMPTDRPPDDIIEDDVELDRWYENYQRESAKKAAQAGKGDPRLSLMGDPKDHIPQFRGN